MAREAKYIARRGFGYCGKLVSRGQVIRLTGGVNDEKLVRLGYVHETYAQLDLYVCPDCGAEFGGTGERLSHVRENHRERLDAEFPTAAAEDAHDRRVEARIEEMAPLYFENTRASREAAHLVPEIRESPEQKAARKAAKKLRKAEKAAKKSAAEAKNPPETAKIAPEVAVPAINASELLIS